MALAGNAALKLGFYFFGATPFQRIGASARDKRPGERHQDRQAFHLLILESKPSIARKRTDGQETILSP